jgi:hypothetical protein
LKGRKPKNSDDLLNSLLECGTEITRKQISDADREWIKSLHEVIRTEREYASEGSKKFLI